MTEVEITKEDLDKLKKRADMLGITYSPNIKFDTLKARIEEKLSATTPVEIKAEIEPKMIARDNAMKLTGVQLICKDPSKKDWQGEIISSGNAVIGTVKKYVLFNEPYHVPEIILSVLKERQYQRFYKKRVNGQEITKAKLVPEFDIVYLDPLTDKELKDLAQRQAMANNIDED